MRNAEGVAVVSLVVLLNVIIAACLFLVYREDSHDIFTLDGRYSVVSKESIKTVAITFSDGVAVCEYNDETTESFPFAISKDMRYSSPSHRVLELGSLMYEMTQVTKRTYSLVPMFGETTYSRVYLTKQEESN